MRTKLEYKRAMRCSCDHWVQSCDESRLEDVQIRCQGEELWLDVEIRFEVSGVAR